MLDRFSRDKRIPPPSVRAIPSSLRFLRPAGRRTAGDHGSATIPRPRMLSLARAF